MTRDEAVAQIKMILGFRSDKTTEIQNQLIFEQNELENDPQLPFFLREEVTNLTTSAGDPQLAVPSGFIREWEEDNLQVQTLDGESWNKLVKDSADYLRSVYQTEEGIPVAYAYDSVSGFYTLFPTPDAVYTLRQTYYAADTVLSSDITNKWLTHLPKLLIGRAGLVLATSFRDQIAMQVFSSMVQSEMTKLNALTTDRDGGGRKYVVGGDD